MSGNNNKGGPKRPSLAGIASNITSNIKRTIAGKTVEPTEEEKAQQEHKRQQAEAEKKQAELEALSQQFGQTKLDAHVAKTKLELTEAQAEKNKADANLKEIENTTSRATVDIESFQKEIARLNQEISKAKDFLTNAAPKAIEVAKNAVKKTTEALEKAKNNYDQAKTGNVTLGQQSSDKAAPITHMRKRSSDSDTEEKRGSNLSRSSMEGTGLPPPPPVPTRVTSSAVGAPKQNPPPLPKRPSGFDVKDIEVPLGTLISKGGKDVLVWSGCDRNDPSSCYEVIAHTDTSFTLKQGDGDPFVYVQGADGSWGPEPEKVRKSMSYKHNSDDDVL